MYEIIKQKTLSNYHFSYSVIRKIYKLMFLTAKNELIESFVSRVLIVFCVFQIGK